MVITSNQKQVLLAFAALIVATGIGFLYWRSTPRRLKLSKPYDRGNQQAIEDTILE